MLRLGAEAGDTPPLVITVELELEAYGIFDAAEETHARIGLFFHDGFSGRYGIPLCCLNYSIDMDFEQTPTV